MSEQFAITDVNFQSFNDANDQSIYQTAKDDTCKSEDVLLFTQFEMDQFRDNTNNNQIMDNIMGPLNINENVAYNLQLMDNQNGNQIVTRDDYNKLQIDMSNIYKTEIKNEYQPAHYIKYKVENGKAVKVWQCGICLKEFGHQYVLMRHLPTHTDERKFQCITCGKAFRQMSTLSQHKAIHSAERPYVCEICNKTFNRVSTLISHRKTHTGHKPHRCHICNKAFHQKGNLRNHIFTHTNERPYKCDVCSKGFNQMSNLMCHKLKAHQRADKPMYTCRTCGKEFQKRIGLRNHEQYEHGQLSEKITPHFYESLRYTNSILVDPIQTPAMRHALATNQIPFALLKPINGVPVLVRVFPAGDKQMLLPASAEDLKRQGHITINPKTEIEEDNEVKDEKDGDKPAGSTVQIRVPVVATVIQSCNPEGDVCMYVECDDKNNENIDGFTPNANSCTNIGTFNFKFEELLNDEKNGDQESTTNDEEFFEFTNSEETDTKMLSSFTTETPSISNGLNDLNTTQGNVEFYPDDVLDLSNAGEITRVYEFNGVDKGSNSATLILPSLPSLLEKSENVVTTLEENQIESNDVIINSSNVTNRTYSTMEEF